MGFFSNMKDYDLMDWSVITRQVNIYRGGDPNVKKNLQ